MSTTKRTDQLPEVTSLADAMLVTVADPDTGKMSKVKLAALRDFINSAVNARIEGMSTVNLIKGSEAVMCAASSNTYTFTTRSIGKVRKGETYAFSMENAEITSGSECNGFELVILQLDVNSQLAPSKVISNDARSAVFTISKDSDNADLLFYAGTRGYSANRGVTFHKVSLVKGDVRLNVWQPSHKDWGGVNACVLADWQKGGQHECHEGIDGSHTERSLARSPFEYRDDWRRRPRYCHGTGDISNLLQYTAAIKHEPMELFGGDCGRSRDCSDWRGLGTRCIVFPGEMEQNIAVEGLVEGNRYSRHVACRREVVAA